MSTSKCGVIVDPEVYAPEDMKITEILSGPERCLRVHRERLPGDRPTPQTNLQDVCVLRIICCCVALVLATGSGGYVFELLV